ncbi:hypothetical protein VTO73DRAFT_7431 [Trametes versicolor]
MDLPDSSSVHASNLPHRSRSDLLYRSSSRHARTWAYYTVSKSEGRTIGKTRGKLIVHARTRSNGDRLSAPCTHMTAKPLSKTQT